MVVYPEEAVRCQSSQAQAVALPDAAVVHCPSARAHHLLVKPLSPATLYSRLKWLATDERPMILETSGFYNIEGIHKTLDVQAEKIKSLENARSYHEQATKRLAAVQSAVEKEFASASRGVPESVDLSGRRIIPAATDKQAPRISAFGATRATGT